MILEDETLDKFTALRKAGKLRMIWYKLPVKMLNGGYRYPEWWAWEIHPDQFTQKEIERLRQIDEYEHQGMSARMVANFLPDGIRPDDVPPL